MIYLIILTFNWELDAIIKLKQLSKVKNAFKNFFLKTEEKKQILRKIFFPE